MNVARISERGNDGISAAGFARFSRLITAQCGIRMPPQKKSMLEVRLRKRLRHLGLDSFDAYGEYLFSNEGMREELVHLIDVVTTNKTDFFREPAHFDYLVEHALPRLAEVYGAGLHRPLRIWSAGCASGEEPYTLAMILAEFARANSGFDFTILATDVSTRVLEMARLGIYRQEKVAPVPPELKRRYLLRSREREREQVRVIPELRAKVRFQRLNFMDEDYGIREPMDVIFCRNVLIYFERQLQQTILTRLCRHLPPGRYLFTGHSETLGGLELPLSPLAPSVYRRI